MTSLTKTPRELNNLFAKCDLLKYHLMRDKNYFASNNKMLPEKLDFLSFVFLQCKDRMKMQYEKLWMNYEYIIFLLNLYFCEGDMNNVAIFPASYFDEVKDCCQETVFLVDSIEKQNILETKSKNGRKTNVIKNSDQKRN